MKQRENNAGNTFIPTPYLNIFFTGFKVPISSHGHVTHGARQDFDICVDPVVLET